MEKREITIDDLPGTKYLFAALGGGEEWNQKSCQCDPSVGMAPCQYCAIHD